MLNMDVKEIDEMQSVQVGGKRNIWNIRVTVKVAGKRNRWNVVSGYYLDI